MARKMALPKIGVNMTEAVIAKWLVKLGDTVKDGDAIIEAETDKSTQEIYATESGIVAALLADEGDTVPVHTDIMVLVDEGEEYTPEEACETEADAEEAIQMEEVPRQETSPVLMAAAGQKSTRTGGRIRVSPLAKKMAKELGVDLARVSPATPGGRVVARDIEAQRGRAVGSAGGAGLPARGGELERAPMSGVRKTIAARLTQSVNEKPSAALTLTADAGALAALRERYKAKGITVSFDAMLAKVAAKTLEKNRYINTVIDGGDIVTLADINVGVAVDAPQGLVVPVVKYADTKSIAQIGGELAELARAAKEGTLPTDAMQGGTFTITNLGMFGVEQFTPVINPPECCILAVGAVKKEFVPDENDMPVVKKTMQLTLVFDHRIVDGAPAARFLRDFKEFVEMPELMI